MGIKIDAAKIGDEIGKRYEATREAVHGAIDENAHYAHAKLTRETPSDQGQLKASWRIGLARKGLEVYNEAPHAGIVELGARPHGVSFAGLIALYEWARRNAPDAKSGKENRSGRDTGLWSLATGIADKLLAKGQEPTYFVKGSLPDIERNLVREVKRELKGVSRKRRV